MCFAEKGRKPSIRLACAMDPHDPDYNLALPDPAPTAEDQQGMSPNTAGAAAAVDPSVTVGNAAEGSDSQVVRYGATESGVAVRAMTVTVASGKDTPAVVVSGDGDDGAADSPAGGLRQNGATWV